MAAEDNDDVLKIFLSSDNHLGYMEKDPVRGNDSFKAFDEVLSLAKLQSADLVLLSGDLFHDNKPSRSTILKTISILRKHCLGPKPVHMEILSDQSKNFSQNTTVNYEDPNFSVDLPVFAIHGNHDDPNRDGGADMLAALDILSAANLVNYYGRHDEVDNVTVSPILLRKGVETNVALYGMGAMRDERLNRMWSKKKVTFLRPTSDLEAGEDEKSWFNIFSLHQNRDLGRGSKNCVHESMIPEWMDLIVWGHEHECRIEPSESLIGTFRITQPGSTVATSLCPGESVRKHAGLLEIKGDNFRLTPQPLAFVRGFAMDEVSLSSQANLDSEDPKIDEKITKFLAGQVEDLIVRARENREECEELASQHRSSFEHDGYSQDEPSGLMNPELVLVRLKVEHTGFSTLNNQRFGARFVGKVANPADILHFHRKRKPQDAKKSSKKSSKSSALAEPFAPESIDEVQVEELVKENLRTSDKPLEILDEQAMTLALDEFVNKGVTGAIADAVGAKLKSSQRTLIKKSSGVESSRELKQAVAAAAEANREKWDAEEEERRRKDKSLARRMNVASPNGKKAPQAEENDEDKDEQPPPKKTRRAPTSKSTKKTLTKRAPKRKASYSSEDEEDDDDGGYPGQSDSGEETAPTPKPSRGSRARRSTASKKKSYTESPPESEVVDMTVESDSEAPTPAKKRKSPAHKKASPKKPARAAKKPRQLATYDSDSDDEEDTVPKGWGGGDKPVRKSGRKR